MPHRQNKQCNELANGLDAVCGRVFIAVEWTACLIHVPAGQTGKRSPCELAGVNPAILSESVGGARSTPSISRNSTHNSPDNLSLSPAIRRFALNRRTHTFSPLPFHSLLLPYSLPTTVFTPHPPLRRYRFTRAVSSPSSP